MPNRCPDGRDRNATQPRQQRNSRDEHGRAARASLPRAPRPMTFWRYGENREAQPVPQSSTEFSDLHTVASFASLREGACSFQTNATPGGFR